MIRGTILQCFAALILFLMLVPLTFVYADQAITLDSQFKDQKLYIDLIHNSSEPKKVALGLSYDSSLLKFEGYDTLDEQGLLGLTSHPAFDRHDLDQDLRTDRTLRWAWLDLGDSSTENIEETSRSLARLRFAVIDLPGFLAAEAGALAIFPLSSAYSFPAAQWTQVDATTGFLTEMTSFSLKNRQRLVVPYPRALTKMAEPCSPDIDGNGESDGLTDGLLAVRYLFGVSGSALINGALGPGATRTTATQIESFLETPDCLPMLDVDGNGSSDALTDGLLFARYLFGFTSFDLVNGVLGEGAIRTSGDDVAVWVSYYDNPRFVVAEGQAGPGGEVTDIFQDLRIRASGDGGIDVRVIEGRNLDGEPVFGFEIDGEAEIEFVDPNRDPSASNFGRVEGYPIDKAWAQGSAIFLQGSGLPGTNRSPSRRYNSNSLAVYCVIRPTHELSSICDEGDETCLAAGDPVLLVHGFSTEDLGGGEGTWQDFPALLAEMGSDPRYVPFEFRWNSSARFQDVAVELGAAIERIALATGKRVHVVGHSFGGILTRTLVQRALFEGTRFTNVGDFVASVVSLGTPHSGIADSEQTMHGVDFARGQDTEGGFTIDLFEFCGQLTCHQMGEDIFATAADEAPAIFAVEDEPGEIAAHLARVQANPLPDLDYLALIGFTTQRFLNSVIDPGDGLITGWGQRYAPGLSVRRNGENLATQWRPLWMNNPFSNGRVTERLLGFADGNMPNIRPGSANPEPNNMGFRHTTLQETTAIPEVFVECTQRSGCTHDGFLETLAWLATHPAGMAPLRTLIPLQVRILDGLGSALPNVSVRLMEGSNLIEETSSAPDGSVALSLPFVPAQNFSIYASLDGFRTGVRTVSTFDLPSETPSQLGDLFLPSDQPEFGELLVEVVDAITGAPLNNVSYALTRIDQLTPTASGNAGGSFDLRGLLASRYVIRLEREGYENTQRQLNIVANSTTVERIGMSPDLEGEGSVRIVLTWGEDPSDLDSHLWKYRADGSEEYHIFYANRSGTNGDFLDRDDVSSFGPETTTIQQLDPNARYLFAVRHFAGSGSITSTSQAQITVQFANGSNRVFNPPPGGDERWWTVFEFEGGAIRPCNTGCLNNDSPGFRFDGPDQWPAKTFVSSDEN